MGELPGPEAVGVCKLWGIRWPFTSPARNDAESPTNPCYKMLQDILWNINVHIIIAAFFFNFTYIVAHALYSYARKPVESESI